MRIVTVTWKDSAKLEGPVEIHEIEGVCILESTGFEIKKTDDYIILAQDWYKTAGVLMFRQLLTIPTECIVNVQYQNT